MGLEQGRAVSGIYVSAREVLLVARGHIAERSNRGLRFENSLASKGEPSARGYFGSLPRMSPARAPAGPGKERAGANPCIAEKFPTIPSSEETAYRLPPPPPALYHHYRFGPNVLNCPKMVS